MSGFANPETISTSVAVISTVGSLISLLYPSILNNIPRVMVIISPEIDKYSLGTKLPLIENY